MLKPVYCRLSVILAREAPKAVIFRKGPSRWVQLILWHTDKDTFETGQWFHGAIFPNSSDLSPDGSKLIYLASKHYIQKTFDPEYGLDWTAISKPPYLTALALWSDAGGGYFIDNNTVYIWNLRDTLPHRKHIPPESFNVVSTNAGKPSPSLPQILNGGWIETQSSVRVDAAGHAPRRYPIPDIWQNDRGAYRIIKRGLGWKWFDFTLQHIASGTQILLDTDTWADWDQQGRLVYVNQGRIIAGHIKDGVIEQEVLADFNNNKPEQIISPDWARKWD